ncbi:MAG: hypothetical protein EA424_23925 [Planctomycetaceae bacterium]|nr:MAG: hypothetical protein EA424_23925 [Planctomycetaceae bacterium]
MKPVLSGPYLAGMFCLFFGFGTLVFVASANAADNPFDRQGQEKIALLDADEAQARARAAQALGYMRYYPAESALIAALTRDDSAEVRRDAALSLGWCGGRRSLMPLVERLADDDWNVRQSAWVALTNITGMEYPFDALADRSVRNQTARVWRQWCSSIPEFGLPDEVLELLDADCHRQVQRGLRAAGALGDDDRLVALIQRAIGPWVEIEDEEDAEAKWRVQTGIRALGRSGSAQALPVLVSFLNNTQWARYAADSLGDLGGEQAAAALLAALPRYGRPLDSDISRDRTHRAPGTHPSDIPHADSRDRILVVPYAICQSLSRIAFEDPSTLEQLREHAPLIAAQIPLDIDGLLVYDEEPFQLVFRHLLDRAGASPSLLDTAFATLGQPRPAQTEQTSSAEPDSTSSDRIAAQSNVLRGRDEPQRIRADIEGWTDLYLIVDEVENYSMDRANWAEAKLVDDQGTETFLDTLEPVSARQQHDSLRINRSASFEDLRIGQQRFPRGLHTHARSTIHYRLDGTYRRFEAQVGVCASRSPGQGSVRFLVSADPIRDPSGIEVLISDPAYASNAVLTLCRDPEDIPRLVDLLDHDNHWVRINAARTLMFMGASQAVPEIGERLRLSPPEAAFGFFNDPYFARAQGQDEFNDPTPRYREALIMALGWFRAEEYVPLLVEILFDDRNSLGIQYRAANALDQIGTPAAIEALRDAEHGHPYHSVRMVAREALWRRHASPWPRPEPPPLDPPQVALSDIPDTATRFVFIKGDPVPYNPFQMDSWRQAYMTTDSGPTYRMGRNLYVLDLSSGQAVVAPLTRFTDGYVADCEVSYDGQTVLFSRRTGSSPWWHIYQIHADGTGLRQVTNGPYHDVQPAVMPSGRIAFSTTRLGTRDEYHGYLCTGLATMHPDGSDIQVIGFNFGRDAEPAIDLDGRILFTRLELFYSRMKTEFNLLGTNPDGTRMHTLYGPERRHFWGNIHGGYANWFAGGKPGGRHRHLRLTQPRPFQPGQHLLTTPAGPILTQGREGERLLRESYLRSGGNDPWVITTPYPLDDRTLLVAAGEKNHELVRAEFPDDAVDLGLYTMCVDTGQLNLLYNDPQAACFEARPLHPRQVPPVLSESAAARSSQFTGWLFAQSAFITQEPHVPERGRLLRVVEALPQVTRHATHTTPGEQAWKNHGGAFGRDLAILPLAADGSFAIEAPADRFLHLQVLDSDRNVVGNQLVWMNLRPGEVKGCVGCHEPPGSAPLHATPIPLASLPIFEGGQVPRAVPDGPDQFRYRAKIWFKGHTPDEREERQRTVQSINWFGRP